MQTLNQDIKTREFKRFYLLFGEEEFLKQSYKKRLREAIAGDDTMNYNYFEGKGMDVRELISLANTMPFFSERRLILVEDSGFFKAASDELVEAMADIPDTTCMVFVESAVDKRNRLYKKVKELGYAAELKKQDASQLARWRPGFWRGTAERSRQPPWNCSWRKQGTIWRLSAQSWKSSSPTPWGGRW